LVFTHCGVAQFDCLMSAAAQSIQFTALNAGAFIALSRLKVGGATAVFHVDGIAAGRSSIT
jgi:hypothetical protein